MLPIVPDRLTLADHPALRVGNGPDTLLVVPGLNDSLCRVTERRWFDVAMGVFMRKFADGRTVYVVSRPPGLPEDHDVESVAAGYRRVLDETGPATILGLSMGGLVGLELAVADDRVQGLILALAAHRLNPAGKRLVREWRDAARDERWTDIYLGAANVLGTGRNRLAYRGIARGYGALSGPPREPRDFVQSATASLDYDGTSTLPDVTVPTLVVGGTADPFFAGMDFATVASSVMDGQFVELDNAGHEAVVEHGGFERAVRDFLDTKHG